MRVLLCFFFISALVLISLPVYAPTSITSTWVNTSALNVSGTNNISINAPLFFIDTTNSRVGIGTTAPEVNLHVEGTLGGIYARRVTNSINPAFIDTHKARGSLGAYEIVQNGDQVGRHLYAGYDGVTFRTAAQMRTEIDGEPGASDMPGRMLFFTTADGGITQFERMRITSGGSVGIGTRGPTTTLNVQNTTGNLLNISHGSTARMFIDSGGRIGIGTALPRYALEVNNVSAGLNVSNLLFVNQTFVGINTTSSNYLLEIANSSSALNVSNVLFVNGTSGRVGIGTTSPVGIVDIRKTDGLGTYTDTRGTAVSTTALRLLTLTDPTFTTPFQVNQFDTNVSLTTGPTSAKRINTVNALGAVPSTSSANLTNLTLVVMNYAAYHAGSGTVGTMFGINGAINNAGSGSIQDAQMIGGTLTNGASATMTTGTVLSAGVSNSGTIGTLYGIRVTSPLGNTGTITSTYGVYVDDITTGTQTNTPFSFYASDPSAYNYFAGNVGIGTTSPQSLLHVNSTTANVYIQYPVNNTAIASADCDNQAEVGRSIVAFNGTSTYLYVCSIQDGSTIGWRAIPTGGIG